MGTVNWWSVAVIVWTAASLIATYAGEGAMSISFALLGVAAAILAHLR